MLLDGPMLPGNKTAIISGAASPRGIGLATARLFTAHGARVAILDLDADQAQAAASTIGLQHRGYACDVTSRPACDAAITRVLAEFGAVDILVNNAGITQPLRLMDIEAPPATRSTSASRKASTASAPPPAAGSTSGCS